jgi:hypothetical protein
MGRSDESVVDPAVRALVRQLVALLTATMEPGQVEHLLDVEVNGVRCRCQRVTAPAAGQTALSPRERDIVRMVAKGTPTGWSPASWTLRTSLQSPDPEPRARAAARRRCPPRGTASCPTAGIVPDGTSTDVAP